MSEIYWKSEMFRYITRFNEFRLAFIETTGIHDLEIIHYHFENFLNEYCDCEECVSNGEGIFITFKHSASKNCETDDYSEGDYDE